MAEQRRIRVLVAKPGLDGHDRGIKVVARALRDAGMEVIYGGLRQTPEMIVATALEEDVDVIGLSVLSGAHMPLFGRLTDLLKGNGQNGVLLVAGGIIPDEDLPGVREMGIHAVFGPGTPTAEIVAFIQANALTRSERRRAA
jgi:methylmalonyl-CoA mutase, C-terminal domain